MLNENGYYRPPFDEIVADKEQKAKELFGDDIDTSELTPLGKFIRIDAYELAKAYEDIEKVYYSRYPNTATGISLDRLCVFSGVSRNPATYSLHKIKAYSSEDTEQDVEVGIGELVVCGEDDDITFYNSNNYSVPKAGGSVEMIVECVEAGTIGNVASITNIVNPMADIDHIEYIGIYEKAVDTESDYDLRQRFTAAIEGAGSGNSNAIRAAILRVPTVISASIINNDTDEVDVDGRPPHSYECFVYGGEDYEDKIAKAIFDKAPLGIASCSTSENPVIVKVLDDGGYEHTVKFSHTENVAVDISVKYKKNTAFEDDGETQICDVLTTYVNALGVGADVIISALYGKIYSVNGITDITELTIGKSGEALATANIPIDLWQIAHIGNIELVEVK